MKITTTSNEVILLVIKKLGDGHICPNFIEVIQELIQNTGVKDKYLFELERNLELQAAGFLMQKESILLQSQIRIEQFQINLFDRLRSDISKEVCIEINELNTITGKLCEVASDHICIELDQKELTFPVQSIQAIRNLGNRTKSASVLQSKWNFQSFLRSNLIEKKQVAICIGKSNVLSGTISAVYLDHFDLLNDQSTISIFTHCVIYVSKDRDFDE